MQLAPSRAVLSDKTEFVGLASAVCKSPPLLGRPKGPHTPPAKAVALAGRPSQEHPFQEGLSSPPSQHLPSMEATLVSGLLGIGGSSVLNEAACGQPSRLCLLFMYQQCQARCLASQLGNAQ